MTTKQNKFCHDVLMRTFKESDLTYKEMVQISGFSIWFLNKYLKKLKNKGMAHICGYYKDSLGREKIKIFRYGKGNDVMPQVVSDAERQRKYKQNKKLKLLNMRKI